MNPIPVESVKGNSLGIVKITRSHLERVLGPPHQTSNDPYQFPGPVSIWAYRLPDGATIGLECHDDKSFAVLYSNKLNRDEVLAILLVDKAETEV